MHMIPIILTATMTAANPAGAPQAAVPVPPDVLIGQVRPADRPDELIVTLTILNRGDTPRSDIPDRIGADVAADGRTYAVMLQRTASADGRPVPPGGFAERAYRLQLPTGMETTGQAVLSLGGGGAGYAFQLPADGRQMAGLQAGVGQADGGPERGGRVAGGEAPATTMAAEPAPVPPGPSFPASPFPEQPPSAKPDMGNAFLGNLSSYQPIYGVYGPGTNSDGRLQISFKYQLFGDPGAVGGDNPVINGIHFAYTQRMFWDLGANSSPFRNIDFMPEVFYLLPAQPVGRGIALGGQAGFRHESNGRDGDASRSINTLYVQPVATMPVGAYTLSVGPRFLLYAGSKKDNPDIRRYRGNTGLLLEIGQDDGLRLTTNSRLNVSSGKGAIDAELSYPLDRIVETGLNLYLFGQAFTGYGENLLDYDRRTSRLRFGIGIVR